MADRSLKWFLLNQIVMRDGGEGREQYEGEGVLEKGDYVIIFIIVYV